MVAPFLAALLITLGGDGLPVRAPKAVGMSAERLAAIDRVVQRGVTAGGYPGAAVVVGRRGFSVFQKGFGHLGWTKDSPVVVPEQTIYDLASLTKVVGTTTAAMILYDEGRLDLSAYVSQYIPAFSGGMKDSVTIRHLLTHYSGLPAGLNLWRLTRSPFEAKNVVLAAQLISRPGQHFLYSDVGADVMGFVIEAITGQGLDTFLHERVFQPLGMNDTNFRPADSLQFRIAPTEVTPPRGYPLRGEVHDENAYALGGVAGHAGLFSSVSDLAVFAQMLLNKGEINGVRLISDSTISLFTKRTAGTRALGWDTADGEGTVRRAVGEVEIEVLLEVGALLVVHHEDREGRDRLAGQGRHVADRAQLALDAEDGRETGLEVDVRGAQLARRTKDAVEDLGHRPEGS